VSIEDSAGNGVRSVQVTGAPSGAVFASAVDNPGGTFYWTPDPSVTGTFPVTFTASNAIGSIATTTEVTVVAPDGPRRASVTVALVELAAGHLAKAFVTTDEHAVKNVNAFLAGDISNEALASRGVIVGSRDGKVMTIKCPIDSLPALFEAPDIESIVESPVCKFSLDSSTIETGVAGARKLYPPFEGQAGDSIVVGIVDTGIDVNNGDFRTFGGTTRLIGYWDQECASNCGGVPFCTHQVSYGREWSIVAIQAGQVSRDLDGHGTHVAGIAAGNGQMRQYCKPLYTGVAPQADLCIVRLQPIAGLVSSVLASDVLDGVRWIFQKAACVGKSAVVNLSLGSDEGPHDGTSIFDSQINSLTGPGKIIVASAGNNNQEPIHARASFKFQADADSVTFAVPIYTPANDGTNGFLISGWIDRADSVGVTVNTPDGIVCGPVWTLPAGTNVDAQVFHTEQGTVSLTVGDPHGCASIWGNTECVRNNEIRLSVTDNGNFPPAHGPWKINLTRARGSGNVDFYVQGPDQTGGLRDSLIAFDLGRDSSMVVSTPASADSVIAVGAYATKKCYHHNASDVCDGTLVVGQIAPYSSVGPRRDGALKPDITAPGAYIVSSFSANAPADTVFKVDDQHIALQGTSMAAPHVTGAVALLMSRPSWRLAYPSQIKAKLLSTARRDAFTGAAPTATWGAGKLSVDSLLWPELLSIRILRPSKGEADTTKRASPLRTALRGAGADSIVFDLFAAGCPGASESPIVRLTRIGKVVAGSGPEVSFVFPDSLASTYARVRATAYGIPAIAGGPIIVVQALSDSFRIVTNTITAVAEEDLPSARFALDQNSPNPFNPVTSIRFAISKTGPVTVRLFSVSGRLVRTLLDKPLKVGHYRISWDGRDEYGVPVASGLYLMEARSAGERLVRKVTALK
jgi:subtilisin family serine protease